MIKQVFRRGDRSEGTGGSTWSNKSAYSNYSLVEKEDNEESKIIKYVFNLSNLDYDSESSPVTSFP